MLAAIGAVIIIGEYAGANSRTGRPQRREYLGWLLFSSASIVGFYLHYTFTVEIFVLECAIVGAIGSAWLSGKCRIDRGLVLRWLVSSLAIVLSIAWGLSLARGLARSDNIAWIQMPSIPEAFRLVLNVDTLNGVSRFQPLPNLLMFGLAILGLVAGIRRSRAVLVCGAFFVLFPVVLFVVSQRQPVFIERSLVAPSFAACLLAGYGALFLARRLSALAGEFARRDGNRRISFLTTPLSRSTVVNGVALVALLVLATVSAVNTVKPGVVWEPYDKAAEYLAGVMKPGDAAAGTDGVIYYRRQVKTNFLYYKLAEGDTAEARVTYGSPAVHHAGVTKLAHAGHSVYLVLRESIGLVVHGEVQKSYAVYVLNQLGHSNPPIASFGTLSIYRLSGECAGSAPCLETAHE